MNELPIFLDASGLPAAIPPLQLLDLLLSDAAMDIEVVMRELSLRNEMLGRLRRALDRLDCARGTLMAISEAGCEQVDGMTRDSRLRATIERLAQTWPHDYPEGAVEWLLLERNAP